MDRPVEPRFPVHKPLHFLRVEGAITCRGRWGIRLPALLPDVPMAPQGVCQQGTASVPTEFNRKTSRQPQPQGPSKDRLSPLQLQSMDREDRVESSVPDRTVGSVRGIRSMTWVEVGPIGSPFLSNPGGSPGGGTAPTSTSPGDTDTSTRDGRRSHTPTTAVAALRLCRSRAGMAKRG